MAIGKRGSTTEPLTEHDVAERLSRAMLRVWRILAELSNDPDLAALVRSSRFLIVQPHQLREALAEFEGVSKNEEKPWDSVTMGTTG